LNCDILFVAQDLKDILGGMLSQKILDRIIDEADIIGDHKVWRDEFMALAEESFHDASDGEDNQHQQDVTQNVRTVSGGSRDLAASCSAVFDYEITESLNSIQEVIDEIDINDLGANQFSIEKAKSVRKALAASCFAKFNYENAKSLNSIQEVIDEVNADNLGANHFSIEKEKSVRKARQLV
jgi:hypothetical protein